MRTKILSDELRINHVLEAIEKKEEFTNGYTFDSFVADYRTISACLYQYTIIAEAITNVETTILTRHPYPWHKIKAFRNFILHEYHNIKMEYIWDTTQNILPDLKLIIEEIHKTEFPKSSF